MRDRRRAGVLAHPSSLPGRFAIGDLGPGAVRFLDWARDAGFSVWQVLPLHPPGANASPYDGRSAFAGDTILLSPDELARDGLLARARHVRPAATQVDFRAAGRGAARRLARAWNRFRSARDPALGSAFDAFVDDPFERAWLDDWAVYAVLRRHHGARAWTDWSEELRLRRPSALDSARRGLSEEIDRARFEQFLFRRQWSALRDAARERGIEILGDLPFYVATDSADVWANQELFAMDGRGRPTRVGGVPPDAFSATGQRWGQPVYRWDRMAEDGFAWWVARIRAELRLVDRLRLDHFRGFAAYWEIDAGQPTAEHGRWVEGPGAALFRALDRALPGLPFVAEDLGVITPDVVELRDSLGLPGLHVAQFAFGDDSIHHRRESHRPHDVVCTGTHDNDTLVGWLEAADAALRERVHATIPAARTRGAAAILEWVYESPCALAVAPLQDLLGLGSTARMNVPGRAHGNWGFRASSEMLTAARARELYELARATGRVAAVHSGDRC